MTAMFINCPHCRALVATDPATDLPPEHCPRCVLRLREPVEEDEVASVDPVEPALPAAGPARVDETPELADASPAPQAARAQDDVTAAEAGIDAAAPPEDVRTRTGVDVVEPEPSPAMAAVPATPAGSPAARGDDDATARAKGGAAAPDHDARTDGIPDAEGAAPDMAAANGDVTGAAAPAAPRTAQAPSFAARRAPPTDASASKRTRWILPAACAALAMLLGLQWLLADRARLAGEARWRPLVVAACNVFGCSVPAWHEPSALVLVSRDVRPHPRQPGALRVEAVLRNDARWTQAWPGIVLTLSDVDGGAVASRAFTADEYLPARTSSGLESGQTASIRFDVVEPATPVVAFGFDFR